MKPILIDNFVLYDIEVHSKSIGKIENCFGVELSSCLLIIDLKGQTILGCWCYRLIRRSNRFRCEILVSTMCSIFVNGWNCCLCLTFLPSHTQLLGYRSYLVDVKVNGRKVKIGLEIKWLDVENQYWKIWFCVDVLDEGF